MAKLDTRKFAGERLESGVEIPALSQAEVLEALARYKKQNPAKYEAKKAALFARYGFTLEEEKVEEPDASDAELEVLKEKVAKAPAKKAKSA